MVNPEKPVSYYVHNLRFLGGEGGAQVRRSTFAVMSRQHPQVFAFFTDENPQSLNQDYQNGVIHGYHAIGGYTGELCGIVGQPGGHPVDRIRENFRKFLGQVDTTSFVDGALDLVAVICDTTGK